MLAGSLDGLISLCSTLPTFAVTVLTPGGTPKSDAMPWAIVLFCVILGLLVSQPKPPHIRDQAQ